MQKYMVMDEGKTDCFPEFFDCGVQAAEKARRDWQHLTKAEQKTRRIYSAVIGEKMLREDAHEEDGTIDWSAHHSCDSYHGCFDSNE